jgi:hypothetical protein
MQEAFALCLNQKRHDAAGNRVVGYDFEQIMALRPAEREWLKQTGWLGKKTEGENDGRTERTEANQHRRGVPHGGRGADRVFPDHQQSL